MFPQRQGEAHMCAVTAPLSLRVQVCVCVIGHICVLGRKEPGCLCYLLEGED